jgi:hypothetical protein
MSLIYMVKIDFSLKNISMKTLERRNSRAGELLYILSCLCLRHRLKLKEPKPKVS